MENYEKERKEWQDFYFKEAAEHAKKRGYLAESKHDYLILYINKTEYHIEYYHKNKSLLLIYHNIIEDFEGDSGFEFETMNELIDFILI